VRVRVGGHLGGDGLDDVAATPAQS
jgi:hypothetical protein